MSVTRALPLVLLACLATACAPGQTTLTEADRDAAKAEVRAASAALVDALNGHDPDAILAFYDLDADFTYVACTNFMFGGDGFRAMTRSFHLNYTELRYDMAVQSVRVLGPDAAVVSLQGTLVAPTFVTRALRRAPDGRWLVVWEHESWPECAAPAVAHPGTGPEAADVDPGAGSS